MRLIPDKKTTAANVATPIRDVNPTAAEMLKDVRVNSRARMPPIAQNGNVASTMSCIAPTLELQIQQEKNGDQAYRNYDGQALLLFAKRVELPSP